MVELNKPNNENIKNRLNKLISIRKLEINKIMKMFVTEKLRGQKEMRVSLPQIISVFKSWESEVEEIEDLIKKL